MIAMADWMQTFPIEFARCQDFRDILQFLQFRWGNGNIRWADCPAGNGREFEVRAQPYAMKELMAKADWSDELKKIRAMWEELAPILDEPPRRERTPISWTMPPAPPGSPAMCAADLGVGRENGT